MIGMKRIWFGFMFIMLLMAGGCISKNVVTDSGEKISEDFLNLYVFVEYSKQFSDISANVVSDLYESNHITEGNKKTISKIWKKHKKYNNKLQVILKNWYNKINNGRPFTDKEKAVYTMEMVVEEMVGLDGLLVEYTKIPDLYLNVVNKIFALYNEI